MLVNRSSCMSPAIYDRTWVRLYFSIFCRNQGPQGSMRGQHTEFSYLNKIPVRLSSPLSINLLLMRFQVEMIITAPNSSYCLSSLAALRKSQSQGDIYEDSRRTCVRHFCRPGVVIQKQVGISAAVVVPAVAHRLALMCRKERHSLTTRTMIELQAYIANTFPNDTPHCAICHEMMFRGIGCHTRNYEGVLHSHCYAGYKRARQTCLVCNTPWNGDSEGKQKKSGEGAFVEGQDKHSRARREGTTMRMRMGKGWCIVKMKRKAREESMDVDVEAEEAVPRRSSGRNKVSRDEVEEEEAERSKRESRR